MAIIDPDGLFNGDRLARCSDAARLHWPYLFLASNGHGRIEIHHGRICSRAFQSFKQPPTEAELLSYFLEFSENFLIFLYSCAGQAWGQWDTDKRFLPRHHTKSDDRSPAPPEEELKDWKQRYLSSRKITVIKDFGKLPKSLETFGENVRGVGVGVGVGEGIPSRGDPLMFARGVMEKLHLGGGKLMMDAVSTAIARRIADTGNPIEAECNFICAQFEDWRRSPAYKAAGGKRDLVWFEGHHYNDDPEIWKGNNGQRTARREEEFDAARQFIREQVASGKAI